MLLLETLELVSTFLNILIIELLSESTFCSAKHLFVKFVLEVLD